jgi:membrane-associated protease RseP (regulator of RpoE activity)
MQSQNWKQAASWLAMVAAILLSGAAAQAGSDEAEHEPRLEVSLVADYWIGLAVGGVNEAVREQLKLGEEEGVAVLRVAPDSPAAKAGIKRNDILLKAGDKPLKRLEDLRDAVAASRGKAIAITLIQGGERKTIEVTPESRHMGIGRPVTDRLFRVMRPLLPIEVQYPKDLSITVHKEGNEPGKITVARGDKKWEVTDQTIGELPDDVRGYVEIYLGKMPTPPLPRELEERLARDIRVPFPPGMPEDIERRLRREAGQLEQRLGEEALPRLRGLQERLENLERRLEERLRNLEKKQEQPTPPPKEEHGV